MEKPKSVAAYFEKLPPEQREPLQKLRETIAAAAPDAEEGITYSMPGFLLGGKGFFGYGERFPTALVRKVVRTRLAEASA